MTRLGLFALATLAAGGGCRPALDDRPWLVSEPRIVGWKAEPPEVNPGGTVAVMAFVVDPAGPADGSSTTWTLCQRPKPLDENRPVPAVCLAPADADATGNPVQLTIPSDACRLFGPDTPQPVPGAPPTRPRDPDVTGGYYQPITIAFAGSLAVGLERVSCGLADASLAVSRAFQATYRANQNPALAGLAFTVDGAPVDPAAIPPGARVWVEATWRDGSAESFPVFDRASSALRTVAETLTASWHVTGGALDRAAAEVSDVATLSSATGWTAPADPGAFEIVVVLRDSRGGSDAARASLTVR